ncbi:MAG: prenyltransferase [Deltaproteobacteria bacterium]|nr:prenyltransferase [Deltaproteobacteria bacterium]
MNRTKTLFLATRPQFFPAVIIPVLLGASTAWHYERLFSLPLFLLTVIAALFYHAGMNTLNDYFDNLNNTDNINKTLLTPFTGGSRMIQRGLMTAPETLALGALLLACGSFIGLYLVYQLGWTGWPLLVVGGFGLFTGFFYSAPPLFFAGRGFGELIVGINLGLLVVCGAYFVQMGSITTEVVLLSLPTSFLISALLLINEFPDYEADKEVGKRNLVVIFGQKNARYLLLLIITAAYLSIIIPVVFGVLPVLSLVILLTLPLGVLIVVGIFKNYDKASQLVPSIKLIIATHALSGALLVALQFL